MATVNAFILEAVDKKKKRPQDKFRLDLGKRLIGEFSSRKRRVPVQVADTSPLPAHNVVKITENKRGKKECELCRRNGVKTPKGGMKATSYRCQQCGIALCKNTCFRDYHLRRDTLQ